MANDFIPRHLVSELHSALSYTRVVNLIGPRQVGKTTLVRDIFERGKFITLDDEVTLQALNQDAYGHIASLSADLDDAPLIIDEAQRSDDLSLAIKRIVDINRRKGQFVLTGSSNVFRTANVADSLAGRMRTLKLWPLMAAELHQKPECRLIDWALQETPDLNGIKAEPTTRDGVIDLILRGGFPEIRQLPHKQRQRQYRDHVDTIVDRDVADIVRIRKTDTLRRLIDQMAARTGQEINVSELSNALKVHRETLEQFLDVLRRLSVIHTIGAWTSGEGKREIRNPKYHFVDSGIGCALRLMDEKSFEPSRDPIALGGLLESYVFNELLRSSPFQERDVRFYHWRSRDRREIDILIEAGSDLIGVEVKASSAVKADDVKQLKWFAADGPARNRRFTGLVFYLGTEKATFGNRTFALPVSSLWANIE